MPASQRLRPRRGGVSARIPGVCREKSVRSGISLVIYLLSRYIRGSFASSRRIADAEPPPYLFRGPSPPTRHHRCHPTAPRRGIGLYCARKVCPMTPADLALAFVLLTAPPGPPEAAPSADDWPGIQ